MSLFILNKIKNAELTIYMAVKRLGIVSSRS
jgi:hypothetical protein